MENNVHLYKHYNEKINVKNDVIKIIKSAKNDHRNNNIKNDEGLVLGWRREKIAPVL
jgi:hypothetical protein